MRSPHTQFIILLIVSIVSAPVDAGEGVEFNRDIRPILQKHCLACHGGVKQAADLSFVYRDKALAVIEPGDPAASKIVKRVTAEADADRMPPPEHGPRLTNIETELLRDWIVQGASWQRHWSYKQPVAQELPSSEQTDWCRRRLDHFVLAKIEQEGLQPSPAAAADRWFRRVSLDLIGLPPTPDQRATFLQQIEVSGEQAYEDAVDRLLASPHFGERWAAMWLDLVRYADSKGLGQDGRRTIWKYRDWVIRALNQDMPFDEFTVKQLAGDLLPNPTIDDLVATACHRLTQTNEEGGTDDEQFRLEAVMDRVNTTWQVWQGITFGCTQCHSHPYDPIEHAEYYRFLAFFNNSVDCDLSNDEPAISVPLSRDDYERASQLDAQIDQLRTRLWQSGDALLSDAAIWLPVESFNARTNNDTRVAVKTDDGQAEFHTRGTVSQNTDIVLETDLGVEVGTITAIRLTGLPHSPQRAIADSEWGFVVSHFQAELILAGKETTKQLTIARVIADEPDPLLDPQASLQPKSSHGFGAYSRVHHSRSAAFVLESPVDVPTGARLRVTFSHKITELGAFPLVTRRGRLSLSGNAAFTDWLANPELMADREKLEDLKAQRRKIPTVRIPVMRERFNPFARPTHVFERGNFLDKAGAVTPGTPNCLPPLRMERMPTRLDLAKWIASESNPLTARVMVNRIWGQMFGAGIVETQEDFGSTGTQPSHPKLLDDLAVRFAGEMNWSTKKLLAEIALSATYRQSSRVTKESFERDPANRLLARGPRTRLPAETVRDQVLAISGLLSEQMYGPPVHPPIPAGVWNPFQGSDKWNTPELGDPNRYRRSVYTYTKRSIPYPMFAAFDAPSREFCSARRLRSNTPLQVFMTLNDQTLTEASQAFAKRMKQAGDLPGEQIAAGFCMATCRLARKDEVDALVALYERTLDRIAQQTDDGKVSGEIDLQRKALSQVALVLLNLDEVLCK